ncbi:MAG: hypothetical protein LBE02_07550 [Spirochaetaceae bacterium]|nr:hypothetical protein [Spirochaetaceae bacterium]
MKNIAKLVLFFSLSFMALFFLAGFLDLLQKWTDAALIFPPPGRGTGFFPGNLVTRMALPAAFYGSILLGLNYSTRRRMAYPAAFAVIFVCALGLSAAAFTGLESLQRLGGLRITMEQAPAKMVEPGFIFTTGSSIIPGPPDKLIFLEDPYKTGAARAVSRGSFFYQGNGPAIYPVRLPFPEEKSRFLGSITEDFLRSAQYLAAWFETGLLPYGVYAGSLALFLLSLGCLVNISYWSLANLFLGILAFRGALMLDAFLNQPHIHELLSSFAQNIVHESLVNPIIFSALGALILLYSALVYLARGRISNG